MIVTPSVQRLYEALEYLVDERVGVIHHAGEVPREPGAPEFFHFYAKACNTRAFCRHKNFGDTGGASSDRGLGLAKAIGEAVERYCAAYYDAEHFAFCSYDSAAFQCVAPETFALYSESQYRETDFPYVPFTRQTRVRWVRSSDALTGEECGVPAAMVFIPYSTDRLSGEAAVVQPISTGLACHCSTTEAAVTAICEVIERDAFTIMWQARLSMPQVRQETLSEQNRDLIKRFTRTGSAVSVLNITMEHGIPTILSVLQAKSPESPALVFAASADLDPDRALRKCLEELAHTRRHAQNLTSSLPPLVPDRHFQNINSLDRHLRMYCNHDNSWLSEFVFASQREVDFQAIGRLATGTPEKDLQILVDRLTSLDYRVFLADITTADIDGIGLKVVRAIIPGFHPLFMGHRFRALGGSRLWEIPQKLGYEGIDPESGDNAAPHPYP
jgi:ribosomal protein S12 methylthiotransferase accessory factor